MAAKTEKVEQQEAEEQEEEEGEEEQEFAALPEEMQDEEEEEEGEEEEEEQREEQDGDEEDETAGEVSDQPSKTVPPSADVAQQQQGKEDVAVDASVKQDQEGGGAGAEGDPSEEEALKGRIQDEEESEVAASTAAAAVSTTAAASVVGEMDLKNLEAQATKVAHDMQTAALEMSSALTAGFKSALGGLGAAEPPQSLSKLAGGLASWWSSLDPPAQPKRNEMAEQVQASSKASSELQELLGLVPEENLVESFKCKLLQTYACSHNSFTPAIQMAFQGTLYITDKHTCFTVEERNRKVPFKVLHAEIAKAERHRPQRKGDLSDVLRLDLVPGTSGDASQQFLAFKDFDSGSDLDSALALVEHLMDGS